MLFLSQNSLEILSNRHETFTSSLSCCMEQRLNLKSTVLEKACVKRVIARPSKTINDKAQPVQYRKSKLKAMLYQYYDLFNKNS